MVYSGPRTGRIQIDGALKEAIDTSQSRLMFVAIIFCLSFTALGLKIAKLGIISGTEESETILDKGSATEIRAARINIVDRNGETLATNLRTGSLYANPKKIIDATKAANELVALFPDLNKDNLLKQLTSNKGFAWIKRNLSPKEQEAVLNLGIPGLEFAEEEKRVYPHGNLISHILGFVGVDGHGLSGIEKEYNDSLTSATGSGGDLKLTIDARVQYILYQEIYNKFVEHKAIGAAGIIMDVNNGEIIGLVSIPDFDPNNPSTVDKNSTFNNATLGIYEVGSIFKTFTLSTALDLGATSLTDSYDATQPLVVGRRTIHDYHPQNRWLTVPEVFMYSSNIGTARIADKIGAERERAYLKRFGLLDPLLLEIPEKGTPMYPDTWSRINTMTIAYGHGISVTLVHVASAMAAVVNGGIYRNATIISGTKPVIEHRVIKKSTSDIMRKLLRLVVAAENGTGKKADAAGYLVGGKTGTADKVDGKTYSKTKKISSFIAVFPMNKPKYVIIAMFDEPHGTKETYGFATAGWVAAPVVKNIVEKIAPILGVKPVDDAKPEIRDSLYIDYTPQSENSEE